MNDTELDALLDSWEAPSPTPRLRSGLRERFPRGVGRRWRPLRWVVVVAVAWAALAIGVGQTSGGNPADWLFSRIQRFYEGIVFGIEVRQAAAIANSIQRSDPKVYVDGVLIGPLGRKGAGSLWLDVPGQGVYGFVTLPVNGFVAAGRIRGNVVEFQAGGRQVRIVCDRAVTDRDRPVYVRRQ